MKTSNLNSTLGDLFDPLLSIRPESRTEENEMKALGKRMLELIGEDVNRQGLLETPKRFAKSMSFLTSGYGVDTADVVGDALFNESSGDLVFVRDIEFFSMCEHHMLPFMGKVHVAYIPNGKVIGLSKIPRIVDVFSRRLQVQERLTHQIAEDLERHLKPKGVAVFVEAIHLCMMMRGVEKQKSSTFTKATRGAFATDASLRNELMTLLQSK